MSPPEVNEHTLNSLLAGFLVSSLPVKEQSMPRQWLQRLKKIPDKCQKEQSKECEDTRKSKRLLQNLLIGLLGSKMPEVFREPPPPLCLPEPEEVASALSACSMQWAWDLQAVEIPEKIAQPSSLKSSIPSEFFSKQPIPCNGAFCYGAVFSQPSPSSFL